tara:strand:+ start:37 stop:807 length:771 start_codon:yes stop_codon:yes gene_type:complete
MSYTRAPKYSTDPIKVLKKSIKVEDHCQGFLVKQIADIEIVLAKSRESSSIQAIQLNNKPDSPFYGLKHMTKFQTLKYIADKFDICDDMIDLIYKKLKQQTIYSPTSYRTSEEVARIPRNIIRFMSGAGPHSTYDWRQKANYTHRFLYDESQLADARENGHRFERIVKIDNRLGIRVLHPYCSQRFPRNEDSRPARSRCEYVGIHDNRVRGAETETLGCSTLVDLTKAQLQGMLDYNGTKWKKSWKKSKLVEEIVK